MSKILEEQVPLIIHKNIKPGSVDEISFNRNASNETEPHFIRKKKAIRLPSDLEDDSTSYDEYRDYAIKSIRELQVAERLIGIDIKTLTDNERESLKHIVVPKTFTFKIKDMGDFKVLEVEMILKKIEGNPYNNKDNSNLTIDGIFKRMQLLANMFDILESVGISHFDTYDENLLLTQDGDLFLIDFDRARLDDDSESRNIRLNYLSFLRNDILDLKDKYTMSKNTEGINQAEKILENIKEKKRQIEESSVDDKLQSCSELNGEVFYGVEINS